MMKQTHDGMLCVKRVFLTRCAGWCGAALAGWIALGSEAMAAEPVRLQGVAREGFSVRLSWDQGSGPWMVETSDDLTTWSAQGEPVEGSTALLASQRRNGFYRLRDLSPDVALGGLFGWLQTSQGEFGELMARHRLKSRWWFYKPAGDLSNVPATTFRSLHVVYQFLENGRVTTLEGPLESWASVAMPGNTDRMTVSWSRGAGEDRRDYELTLDFPYNITMPRSSGPLLSDPNWTLTCTYATAQPAFDPADMALKPTKADKVDLIELAPSVDWLPEFLNRDFRAVDRGVQIDIKFREGLPLYQGSPPFIFKTYVLDTWTGPTSGRGGELPAFTTDSYFARTVLPGHHNFYHEILIEPAVDPALDRVTRDALRSADIRYIWLLHDNALGQIPDDIRFFGFDHRVRKPR